MFRKNNELQGHGSIRKNKIYGTVGVIIFGIIAMFSLHKSVAADDIESPKTTAPIPIAEASDTSLVVQSQMARQEDNTTLTTTKADSATTMNSTSRAAATAPTAAASQAMLSTAQTENQNPNVTVENQELKDAVTEAKNNGIEAKQETTENIGTANIKEEVATLEAEAVTREKEQAQKIKEAVDKYKNDYATAQSNTQKPGYLSEVVTQGLKFENEPNAHLSITGTTEFGQQDAPRAYSYEEYIGSGRTFANNPIAAYKTSASGNFVIPKINKGQTITATYTNLQNSSYNGTKIAKVVYEVTNLNNGIGIIGFAEKDPTKGIYTFYNLTAPSKYGVKIRFYDENDNIIQFKQATPAILALTSLSKTIRADGKKHEEGIADYNFKPVKITGSYVEKQSDNRLAASSPTQNIPDRYNHPDFYKTSIAGVIDNGDVISFTMRRDSEFDSGYWLAITSKLPSPFVLTKPNLSYKFFSYNKAGTVLLDNYIQGTTTKLTETQTVKPKGTLIGESYTGTHEDRITFNGKVYKYVSSSDNITGTVKLGITNVYNSYVEVTGNVIVNYRNQAGETIKESVEDTSNASINTDYNTEEHRKTTIVTSDGKTYRLVDSQLPSNEKGKVIEGTTQVTYVYKEVLGNVTVHYQDESGHQLQDDVTALSGASTNTPYDTEEHRKTTIVTSDGKTYRLVDSQLPSNEKGKVIEGTTQVTYVYKEVLGNVTVHYQDESGHQLQDDVTALSGASTNTPYDTEEHRKTTIVTSDGKTYRLVDSQLPSNEKGKVIEGTTQVTYVYKEVLGNVTVHYQDESGHQLQDDVTALSGASTNTPYDTEEHRKTTIVTSDGKTYRLVDSQLPSNEKGKVIEGTTQVTYVYKEVLGNVTVHYQDESGHQLQDDVTALSGASTNTPYDTEEHRKTTIVTSDGKTYRLVDSQLPSNEKGKVIEGTTQVTYVYKEVLGNVTVHYQDESGHQLQDDVTALSGASTNTPYDTEEHRKTTIVTSDGKTYRLVDSQLPSNEKGKVIEGTTQVTYVYKEVLGNVTVHYQDESGHQLQDDVTALSGASTNTPYDTEEHRKTTIVTSDGKTYRLVDSQLPSNEKGKVIEGTTQVTYVYKEVLGNVTVHYQDESGHQLQDDVTALSGASTNTPYDTEEHRKTTIVTSDGKTYRLVDSQLPSNEKGKVIEGTTQVTYVYKEVLGNVTVHYQDESGHQLQDDVTALSGASTNTPYDTEEHRKTTIVTSDGKTYRLVDSQLPSNEKGKVIEGTTQVTYVYKEVLGNVTVHYQDESGHQLQDDVTALSGASTNTPYDTEEHRKTTIVTSDGKTYRLVDSQLPSNEKGKVIEGTTQVTYVYKEVLGNVTVHYQDESGHQLQDDVTALSGASTNTPYDTEEHRKTTIVTSDGKTYRLVDSQLPSNEKGKVIEGTTQVTYVYKEVLGNVTVHYQDESGHQLQDDVTALSGASTNTPYDTEEHRKTTIVTSDGKTYRLVDSQLPSNEKGKVIEGTTQVTYVYKEVLGNVTVHYQDESGHQLQDDVTALSGASTNTPYDTEEHRKTTIVTSDGKTYRLVDSQLPSNEKGKVIEGTTQVTYVYKEVLGNVTVHYQDESGHQLQDDVTALSGASTNTPYDTEEHRKTTIVTSDGKTYRLVDSQLPSNEKGKVIEGTTQVTYVYKEVLGNVTVHYQDESGHQLQDDVTALSGASTNTPYDTEEHRKTTIVTSDGKTYRLVDSQLPSNEKGKVIEGTTQVTYVYKEVLGNVTVHYQDESGHQLQDDVTALSGASTNTPYDTEEHRKTTIVTSDGKTYRLVDSQLPSNEKGKVIEGTTQVTYVYKEVLGNVTVHYQDESGHQLQDDVTALSGASTNTPYDTEEHRKTTIVTSDGKTYRLVDSQLPSNEKGKVIEGTTQVTYVYKEVLGNVTVHYQDESGHQLQDDVTALSGASTNTPYDTEEHRKTTIVTSDGKTYRLVDSQLPSNEKGKVIEGTTQVTYVYKEVLGNVTVHYQDESGHQLQDDVTALSGASTNTPYDTEEHRKTTIVTSDGKTYRLVDSQLPSNEKGKVIEGTTQVTYVYKEVLGNVTVHYQDESGHQLQDDVTALSGASTNTPYDTEEHRKTTIVTSDGKTYRLVDSQLPSNEKGKVIEGTTQVTYVYKEVLGNVTVHYQDESGHQLQDDVTALSGASTNTPYDTEEHRKTTIVTSDGKTYRLVDSQLPSNEKGKVIEGTTQVTYVYKEVLGNVTVHYQDESGHQLQDDVTALSGASTNTPYDTEEHRKTTIVTSDGKTYRLVDSQLPSNEKGKVIEGTTQVTYVYKEVLGNVTVHYQDESGHQLQDDVTALSGASTNTPYDTEEHRKTTIVTSDGKTYRLVDSQLPSNEKGKVIEGTTQVTYVYKEVLGNVTVHYQDESGHQLQDDVTALSGASTNTPYDTEEHRKTTIVTSDGKTYRLVDSQLPSNEKGKVIEGTTQVTYVYKEVLGNVTVHYQDESGHQLQDDVTALSGASTNTPYDTEEHRKTTIVTSDGKTYRLVDSQLPSNEKGKVIEGTTQVTYVYKEVLGNVTVHYQDESGHQLQDDVTALSGASTNTPYDTEEHRKTTIVTSDGKTYRLVDSQLPSNEKGKVIEGTTQVTYVYKEVLGNVTVHYQDESGHQLQDDVTALSGASTNTPYDTEEHRKTTIVTSDGKTYRLVDSQLPSNEKGKVIEGTTQVTYVYKEVLGNVTVHYQDESGHQLQDDVTALSGASTNTPYDTEEHRKTTIVTSDGKTYRLVDSQLPSNEKGKVIEGTTQVTYVYKEVLGNVTVHYQDESGHQLQDDVTALSGASTNTPYDTEEHRKTTIVTSDGKTYRLVDSQLPSNEKGKVIEGTTQVTYVYKEVLGNVTVHYQDESGHQLQDDVTALSGASTNTPYDTEEHRKTTIVTSDGKTYRLVDSQLPSNEKGKVIEGTTQVTYVYKEVLGNVTVHYQDESGHQLQDDVTALSGASTNTPYDTEEHRKTTIVTSDGKTYRLVDSQLPSNEKGKVIEGTTQVTYVYKEVLGNVTVHYQDESGHQLQDDVTALSGASTNTPYDTEEHRKTTIVTSDGKTYRLVDSQLPSNEKGKVIEGTTQVTYVYKEVLGNVTVHLKHGTAESQESKKVSLTVRYHGAGSQTPADNVQTATWTRTVTKDKVTGDVVKTTDWVADKATYDAVPSPVIPGYTVDVATVSAETVTQEDMVKDVYYTAIPVTPDKPTPPVVPSTPDKPTTPTVVPTTPTKATPTKTEILPSTGDVQDGSTLTMLTGIGLLLSALGLVGHRKKED